MPQIPKKKTQNQTFRSDSSQDNLYRQPIRSLSRVLSPTWLACIPLVAIIVIVWHSAAAAQTPSTINIFELKDASADAVKQLQGSLNTIWVLIAAILVIFMNAGFAMLETGFCRQKNAVNILTKNLIVFALATIAYWAIGYALMFGSVGNGFIGLQGWFLGSEDPATYGLKAFPEGLPISVHFLFQVAFAGTAATIVSGAVAERIKFVDFLIFSLLLTGIAYPITGHWAWGGGWLAQMGFKDFAGSAVVHMVGGVAALVGAALLGPRQGKYQNGKINAIPGHNMSIATLGCLILWIGWFGFNPGSQLAVDPLVPYIALTTNLAAAAGGIVATVTSWAKDGKPDLSMVINGILAGLVAITAGCNGVTYWEAILIGVIAGVIVVFAVGFFDRIRIDDPVGATSVHLVCGIWGVLATGVFADGANIVTQIIGILAIAAFTGVFSFIAWTIIKAVLGMRVEPEEEFNGLDVGEHGMEAYSGFVKESDLIGRSSSTGMGKSSEAIGR